MSLSKIQILRVAAVLEDCFNQLDILGHTLTHTLTGEEGAKLRRDCEFFSQQISQLRLELEEKQTFSSLIQAVEEMEQKRKAENRRREEEEEEQQKKKKAENRRQEEKQKTKKAGNRGREHEEKTKREAERELEERKEALQRQNEELQAGECNTLSNLPLELEQLKKDLDEKIAENTTELRLKQTEYECSQAEKQLEEQLERLHKQMREERRGHEGTMKLLQNRRKELQQQLQDWRQRTEQMLQEKQQKLNIVSYKRIKNLDTLMEMRRRIIKMERVVKGDREERDKLQAEARAATKLQAWWRGCMVHQGLGSFRKAEEGKKDKKKKKGKKTKGKKK